MIGAVFLGVGRGLSSHTVDSVLRMSIHVRVRGVVGCCMWADFWGRGQD